MASQKILAGAAKNTILKILTMWTLPECHWVKSHFNSPIPLRAVTVTHWIFVKAIWQIPPLQPLSISRAREAKVWKCALNTSLFCYESRPLASFVVSSFYVSLKDQLTLTTLSSVSTESKWRKFNKTLVKYWNANLNIFDIYNYGII